MTSRDDLRIGDAERDAAVTALREHYAQGRLTHEELDERIELTLSARTGRELALTSADLPDLYGPRPEDRDGPAPGWEHGDHGWAGPWHGHHGRGSEDRDGPTLGWEHRHHRWAGPWHGHHGRGTRRGGHHPAAWHRHRAGRRGGPPVAPFLILMLVIGVATTGFWALKFVFLAWLAMAVAGMLHRRRWQHVRAGGGPRH
ncbi:DUF1707 SHOCT-like domain-containing protein [Streptosporangium minutum]|uniref:DUF1707 domain-containing protein n=1 Tax=Streptosporangium minutum TaxID=569862 RepID=A0A243R9L4_9ACTN|nr:DUF1707 domain-containing protein [Streptosporangium minutum]OUC91305.1 hypothetical protein CA984_34275 [Streptosporangium minutum]